MNKTATVTLIAILSGGALMAVGTTMAQPAGPGYGAQGQPCPRAAGMGRGGWGGGDRVAKQLDRMAWRLNLSDAQRAQLEPILRQREELRTAQRQAMRDEVAAILTPEQLTQFEQMGPGRGGRMGRGGGPGWNVQAPVTQP